MRRDLWAFERAVGMLTPPGRSAPGAQQAAHRNRGGVVVEGGRWTQLASFPARPSEGHMLAATQGNLYIYGGQRADTKIMGDLWRGDGRYWELQHATATVVGTHQSEPQASSRQPPARAWGAIANVDSGRAVQAVGWLKGKRPG